MIPQLFHFSIIQHGGLQVNGKRMKKLLKSKKQAQPSQLAMILKKLRTQRKGDLVKL